MTQTLAISQAVESLSLVEEKFNLVWVLVVEEKATRIAMETALPQGLAYMASNPTLEKALFGLITNGNNFIFIKQQRHEYALSDSFALLSHQNKLYDVLQILKQIRDHLITTP